MVRRGVQGSASVRAGRTRVRAAHSRWGVSTRVACLALDTLSAAETAEWERLVDFGGRAALFVTPEWLQAWRAELGQTWTPLLLHARADSGAAALLPLGLRPPGGGPFRILSFLGSGSSDYLAPLADPEGGAEGVAACLDAALEHTAGWELLDLGGLPAESATVNWLTRAARARGMAVAVEPGYRCPELALASDWAAYLRMRGGHFRHWLRSKRRRLERLGPLAHRHVVDLAQLGPVLEEAARLHALRWRGRYDSSLFSASAAGRRFYHRAVRACLERGRADLALLELDGRPIAFALSLLRGDTWAYLVPGHDPAYERHSPGGLLLAHLVEQAHERGMAVFDFMIGEEEYKYQWATREHYTVRLLAGRPGGRGRLAMTIARARLRLRAALRTQHQARLLRDRAAPVLRRGGRGDGVAE